MNFIVDVQGFKCENNRFIVKEFALIHEDKSLWYGSQDFHIKFPLHYLIKSPYPFNEIRTQKIIKNVLWLSNNYHFLKWDVGDISFRDFKCVLRDLFNPIELPIYMKVKGNEKEKYIQHLMDCIFGKYKITVVNLEEFEEEFKWPKLFDMKQNCTLYNACDWHKPSKKILHKETNCALQNVLVMQHFRQSKINVL